jgi:hypothetical protein
VTPTRTANSRQRPAPSGNRRKKNRRGQAQAVKPFQVRDCALIAISTGRKIRNLRELRDGLFDVDASSLDYHFWGSLLRPGFEERDYINDFAEWIYHELREKALAERLAIIDPSEYADNELLRQELIDIIEESLDQSEYLAWSKPDNQFEFIRAQTVVFSSNRSIEKPEMLAEAIPQLSVSSIFYHFIDARRRVPDGSDDFCSWLAGWGERYAGLRGELAAIDPYFSSLVDLREQIASVFEHNFRSGNDGGSA